ncbi:unnamed protein product [Absidia cylindrospora]
MVPFFSSFSHSIFFSSFFFFFTLLSSCHVNKKVRDLEKSSSQKQHPQLDNQQQRLEQVQPISRQQEQQHLQLYWQNNNNNDESWTQDNEEKLLQSWASRTFSATCYKFTIQNNPATRQKAFGPIYSFLENWQLHSMYNKSQKVLLGIADRRPCVLLTGDDFMFTPPPLKDDTTTDHSLYQRAQMDYLNDDDDDDDDLEEEGDTSGGGRGSGSGMDEHLWMLFQPTPSSLHVVNVSSTDEDDDDDDDNDDISVSDQQIMVMGRDQGNTGTTTFDDYSAQRPLVSPALVRWYQTVESSTSTTIHQQRRPSTIMIASTNDNDHYQSIDTTPTKMSTDDSHSTLIADTDENDDNTSTFTTITDNSSSNTSTPVVALTWRQWLQQGVMFLSQRMVEVAYLVAELAESLATAEQHPKDKHHQLLMMTHAHQDGRFKASSSSPKLASGHYIVQLFRVWRVFFLGVETMMNRLFSLDPSLGASSSHSIVTLPLLTKSSSTLI